ncbi:MAG: hypothetical protein JSU69_10790, partial [Candidatus Zixiibacteriota bacterium]
MVQYRQGIRREVRIDTGSWRAYFRGVYFVAAFIVAVILCLPGPVFAGEGFSVLGVEFPAMDSTDWLLESDVVSFTPFPLKFDMLFYLSTDGTVDSFTYSPETKQIYIDRVTNSLESIHFYPARINDTAVSFILPAELLFSYKYGKRYADLRLPYNEPECHKSRALIEKTLRLNGFSLPGIKQFPSYFCALTGHRDLSDYPYIIFEIELDSSGALVEFHELYSSDSNVCKLISKSLLYADFLPASYKGRNFPQKFFLVVRFFDVVNYPTSVWPSPAESSVNLPFEYIRLGSQLYLNT